MNARLLKFVAVFLGAALSGWAADPLIGTWKLDLSKSIFNPGPTPKVRSESIKRFLAEA
jgi:hypothetical protein